MSKTIAIYIRANNEQQIFEEKRKLIKYTQRWFGNAPVTIYIEKNSLCEHNHSPKFQELLSNIRKGEHKIIVLKDLYRLTSESKELAKVLSVLGAFEVSLLIESYEEFELHSTVYLSKLLEALIKIKKSEMSQTSKKYKSLRASYGYFNGSSVFGYDVINGKLKLNSKESEIVKLIFHLRAEGRGYYNITSYLNQSGLLTKRKNAFSLSSVRHILNNRLYMGQVRFRDLSSVAGGYKYIEGRHQAIISMELWERVQFINNSKKRDIQEV
ncbi:recombinase family protein [Rossellomorea vietnamensis]|uniref:recombinase family protein n=1 Tax=Rossellomorea vietnamensis TaxID=218284 RepID=UPI003CEDFF02